MKSQKRNDSITTEINLKIIIVGDMATGKTSIIKRYLYDEFDENTNATIVPDFKPKIMKINGVSYKIHFWDLPGQDRNTFVLGEFARDTQGIIYCCDVENEKSMKNLKKWEEALKLKEDLKDIIKIVVENKCDLKGNENQYNDNSSDLRKMSNELECSNFFRTSALNGYNVKASIEYLINEIIKKIKIEDISAYNENSKLEKRNTIKIKKNEHKETNKDKTKNCC